jgi:ribosomal protein S18 acetylase RimI-like enzyme
MAEDRPIDWVVRPARHAELALVRRKVPLVFKAVHAPDRVLVADAPRRETVGVAAIAWNAWGVPSGFPIWIHVDEAFRRRGCGLALAAAVAREARPEIERVHLWQALDDGDDAGGFLRRIGFEPTRRVLHFEADGRRFFAMVARLHARLAARGRIPAGAHTLPLREAPFTDVAQLVSAAFGSRFELALAAARRRARDGYDADRSVVLIHQGRVQGALLYRWGNGIPEIDVNVVAPSLRRGWANVVLLHDATRNGLDGGADRFRFHCEDTVTDTINLARRAGAPLRRATTHWSARLVQLPGADSL